MELLIESIKTVVFGVIQGITEWLPISSTGHLILWDQIWPMNFSPEFFELFKVLIQLGSIFAVLIIFFHKLNPISPKKNKEEKKDTFELWFKVVVACIPGAIMGLLFDDLIEEKLSTPFVIATTLILFGIWFIFIENKDKTPTTNTLKELSYKTALFIGLFQCLALIPGTSRSGSTIIGAICLGTSRVVASEFSFFLAIPMMFGASCLKLVKYFLDGAAMLTGSEIFILLLGMFVAFVVSVFAIKMLMSYIKKHDFKVFGYYRIVLGIIIFITLFI